MISIPVPDPQCCQAAPSQPSRETPEQELGVLLQTLLFCTHVFHPAAVAQGLLEEHLVAHSCPSALSKSISADFLGTACSWELEMAPTQQLRLTLLWALTTSCLFVVLGMVVPSGPAWTAGL